MLHHAGDRHENPQMYGVEPVKEILRGGCVEAACAVVEQCQGNDRDHHPFAIETEGVEE